MQYSKIHISPPTVPVPELGGVHIAAPEFRSIIGRQAAGLLITEFVNTAEGYDAIEALQLAARIFSDCFSDITKLTQKYEGIELGPDFSDSWLDFGATLISDLDCEVQDYLAIPANKQKLTELFMRFEPYRKANRQKKHGSRGRAKFDNLHEEYTKALFTPGIREGVRTAVAYYEVASHLAGSGRYPIGLIGPVRRLIAKHSGLDEPTNDHLLSQLRRTSGDSYDDLLFDPSLFEITHRTGNTELTTRYGAVAINSTEDSIVPVGCPAFSYGTIAKLCKVIESVLPAKYLNPDQRGVRSSDGELIMLESSDSAGIIDPKYRDVYLGAYALSAAQED